MLTKSSTKKTVYIFSDEQLYKWIWAILRSSLASALRVLRYLLFFCNFAEFQNRHRPKCTTMPWNIWLSLVVLWGVCWMFYPDSSYLDGTPYQFPLNDELLSSFALEDFELSALSESISQLPNHFDLSNDLNLANLGAPMRYEAFEDSSSGFPRHFNFPDQSLREATTSLSKPGTLIDIASTSATCELDNVAESMLCATTSFADSAWQPQLNQSLRANFPESSQANSCSERAPPLTVMRPSALLQQTPLPLQICMTTVQAQSPTLNADGKMICNRLGCSNETFERKCDWQIHENRHTRPFRCIVEGCARTTAGYATKGELKRHNQTHKRRNGEGLASLFYCSVSDCLHAVEQGENGFDRKDGLRAHMRQAHPGTSLPPALVPRPKKVSTTSNSTETFTTSPEPLEQTHPAPNPRKRKRTAAKDLDIQYASEDAKEDVRPEEEESIKENKGLVKENERLVKENERLEREVERCHEMNQRLLVVIDRLT